MFNLDRRTVIASAAASVTLSFPALASPASLRAIAFDAFPIFDPRSIPALAQSIMGDEGPKLTSLWSSKLFSYTWLETAAGHYDPFHIIAERALRAAAESMNMAITDAACAALVAQYNNLDVWPDVKQALAKLRENGVRLRLLSNLSIDTLNANMERNDIKHYFERPLSTDLVKRFKPSPAAYAMALDAFGLPKDQIGFAAFGGWDAIGASWFGYRTAWINRTNAPLDPLATRPEIVTQGIGGVLAIAGVS